MAKSKSGGTRSYLRGRVGADVYSVGKDGKGKKQQVVRSLAETVANPRTSAQMFGRMVMYTIMQAVSEMSFIIDHSFDNVPNGQPSISEFIRRNYKLVANDAKENPSRDNKFGLVKFGEKGMMTGAYVVAAGDAILPSGITMDATDGVCKIAAPVESDATTITAKALFDGAGLSEGDFLTLLGIKSDASLMHRVVSAIRLHYPMGSNADTVITTSNVLAVFNAELVNVTENEITHSISVQSGGALLSIGDSFAGKYSTVIFSKKTDAGYKHSNAQFPVSVMDGELWSCDSALPTYPTGEAKFLNGGDL